MAPRGLSHDEKRVRLLEIFHETKDFYQLKELEKLAPKSKGIVSQTVKEVLQSLVDDGLVQCDKIGASNIFWAFPSQRGAILQGRVKQLKETRAGYVAQQNELNEQMELEKACRVDTSRRRERLETLAGLKKQHVALVNELEAYGACDPVKLEEKRRAGFLAHEAAVRWTDNFGMLLGHCTRQNNSDGQEIRRALNVDDDFEDIV
ncbi:meiotic nuclear division protein 1 [Mycena amicta]|nr:meiotic nuclear division protein 1 [Mycena amicta]